MTKKRIISIIMLVVLAAGICLAVYGATKAALMNLAQTAALENAPYGITVNTILPGVIETDRNASTLSDAAFAKKLREQIPMHRFGTAVEIECACNLNISNV